MGHILREGKLDKAGALQQVFKRTCSERVKKAIKRAVKTPEICLERARAEIKAYEQYQDEPRVIQRARVLESYLQEKTIYILEDELIVGNVTGKVRASPIFGETASKWLSEDLDHPERDFAIRRWDRHIVYPEERRELREDILPYWEGKTLEDEVLGVLDEETREKTFTSRAACPHLPQDAGRMAQQDAGKQMVNYEKVLHIGLNGIKREAQWYMAQLDQPYISYGREQKSDFYSAVIIALDAVMAYAKRYARLAQEMATQEADPVRKKELERIAEVCDRVPAEPARDWWEALQSVWFIHTVIHCEFCHQVNSFGRFDQYMYPFYKKSVIDEKTLTRDEALELLECWWVKTCEYTALVSTIVNKGQIGFPMAQNLVIAGQTREGEDAVNEVSWLCLDVEEQVGLAQPDFAIRVWEGTPRDFLKRAAEVVRLGRGKPKFYGDRMAIRMVSTVFPDLTINDWRNYAVEGCVELTLPHVNMCHSTMGYSIAGKVCELVLHNGKCALCGKQIGLATGDPRTFTSMAAVRQAFREQTFHWMRYLARAAKVEMDIQSRRMMAPFCSALLEGTLQKGADLTQGGTWYTTFGVWLGGLADTADSLGVIDTLIYRDKKVSWDELLEALNDNWQGHENLRQLCINDVPKYGNDNELADRWAAFVMDIWIDAIDWVNTQRDLLPVYGGKYTGAIIAGGGHVCFGEVTAALPNGHIWPKPLADTMSPVQGMDRKGPTAVIKSVSRMPSQRFTMGTTLNQRFSPQLLASDRDLDNFVSFVKTCEELGIYHIQFNVISSNLLREAMKKPEDYRDLMVRVASYCAYFTELDPESQQDIIDRTEQQSW